MAIYARRVTASGAVAGVAGRPMTAANLNMVAGNVGTAGLLNLRDGGAAGTIILAQALPLGPVNLQFSGSFRFVSGVYVEFAGGLVADLTLYFG